MKRYQKQIQVLESEKLSLQRENEELRSKLSGVLNSSSRLRKLNGLEEEVSALKKKVEGSSLRLGRDAEMKSLQNEILSLKAQKVESQRKMKEESVQFRLCKALLEKEVLQLKENERKKEHVMNTLLVLNQRMKTVMQRKMEEASMSRKRLKVFLEFGKAASNGKSGTGGVKGGRSQEPLIRGLEDSEAQARINGFCSEYDRQMREMIKEIAGLKLKRQEELSKQNDPGCIAKDEEIRTLLQDVEANHKDKDTEIQRLKEEVSKLSDLIKQLEMQKADHICACNLKNANAIEGSKEEGTSKESRSSITSNHLGNRGVSSESKHSGHSEGITASSSISKTSSTLTCCLCSNKSSCKTNKCECRESGASCGTSCGCSSKKCSNRDAASVKVDESPVADVPTGVNSSDSAVVVETTILAAHGAMLLQDALLAKPAQNNVNNELRRKPLSDIGNKMKGDAAKSSRKKKNQNLKGHPAAAPMPPSQQEDSNTPEQSDGTSTGDMVVPKFTRTTRSNASK